MRKSLYIGMVMCLLSGWTARAQRTVDLDFRQVTLNVVFDAIGAADRTARLPATLGDGLHGR